MRWKIPLVFICFLASATGFLAANRFRTPSDKRISSTGIVALGGADAHFDPPDRNTPYEHVFRLYNPTSQIVHIDKVHCGCGCMASELESSEIGPGATVSLKITIRAFDAYAATYSQSVGVSANTGQVDLSISGKLPAPEKVAYRPTVLYMDPTDGIATVERDVLIRVPKQCYTGISSQDIRWDGDQRVSIAIREQRPSDFYREFILRVSVPAELAAAAAGGIRLETGCGPVEISVRPSRELK